MFITHSLQAIALYQMVRAPLNVIPAWIVQILQVFNGTLAVLQP